MSEERFTWKTEKLQHLDDEIIMVVDNENKEWKGHILNIVDKLNELAEENDNCKNDYRELFSNYVALEEKNEQLQKENSILNKNEDDLKECTIENIKLKEENEQLKRDCKSLRDVVKEQDKEIKRLKRNVKRFKDDRDSNFETMKYWKNKALKESEDE